MKSISPSQSSGGRNTVNAQGAVRWGDLPHSRLRAEIRLAVLKRTPEEAPDEAKLRELEDDLPKLDSEDHKSYVTLVIGEMKRELRIWRDHYWDYLDNLNRAPCTIKRRDGLELAVAPIAAIRLAQRASKYLTDSHVDPSVFNLIFGTPNLVCIHLDGSKCVGHAETSIENMMTKVVPRNSFRDMQNWRKFTAMSMVGGPFALPTQPRPASMALHASQSVWISSLCRMWDEVFREMMIYHISIDAEEQVYELRAEERLTQFQKVAGTFYIEYEARCGTPLSEDVWKQLAEILDQKSLPLRENLEENGKVALKAAVRLLGRDITTWAEAIMYEKPADQPAPKETRDGKLSYTGDLSRHAKRAIHRAKDALLKVRGH
jgi:hypothetical protein